jgi:hypothetical protein
MSTTWHHCFVSWYHTRNIEYDKGAEIAIPIVIGFNQNSVVR